VNVIEVPSALGVAPMNRGASGAPATTGCYP
jgi:hypothetical protein